MCARDALRLATVATLALAAGCAGNPAPRDFLDRPAQSQQSAWGGWIELRVRDEAAPAYVARGEVAAPPSARDESEFGDRPRAARPLELMGELAAIGADSVYVLMQAGCAAIALADVERARLTGYEAGTGALVTWSGAGGLSTLSHGFILVISLPVWILAGATATSANEYNARVRVPTRDTEPARSWADMRAYARFPQGLPPSVRRGELRPRGGPPPPAVARDPG